jgi:hypothetical protein
MSQPESPATWRLCRFNRNGDVPAGYRESYEMIEEATGTVRASCDLLGRAVETPFTILDDGGDTWQVMPNRKVMPTRWTLVADNGDVQLQLDLRLADKLINPLQRTSLALIDASDNEFARLIDGRKGVAERMLGSTVNDWILVRNEHPIAHLCSLPSREPRRKGVIGRITSFLTPGDRGIVIDSAELSLSAVELLALMAVHNDVTMPL